MTFGEKVLQASRPDLETARHQGSGGKTMEIQSSQAHGSIESSQGLMAEIQSKITALKTTPTMKRQMSRIQPLPRVAAVLIQAFSNLVAPAPVDLSVIWKLMHLSLKVS
ncbi:hypothetical protein ACEPPN_011288 [Leptodophora sp. 'Broadleaf-Isolate-01']